MPGKQSKAKRSHLSGELSAFSSLLEHLQLAHHFKGDATMVGDDPIIRSPHKLGEASATAQLLIGAAGAAIWAAKTGQSTDIEIGVFDALHFLHPTHYVSQAGHPINVGAEFVETNGIFQCKDGRHVMIEAGPPYPKLLKGYLDFFDCGNNKKSIAREIDKWNAKDLEDALAVAGLPCCRAFGREEWLKTEQGALLSKVPVIEIEKIADGDPIPFSGAASPLENIQVLDFTHVLAGPRSTRSLAEYGAEVLHVSAPAYPDTLAQHLGVDVGKRCAYLDLRNPDELATMHRLASQADVFATTYRNAVNRKFGLTPQELASRSERGIVCMTANAYGHSGPWTDRPGFDQNGQVASGFAVREGGDGPPRFSPVFYLADLMTGYFAAAGTMAALLRRSIEGGSYNVKLSLSRSAMWVQELGLLPLDEQANVPSEDKHPPTLTTIDTVYGPLSFLASPIRFSNLSLPSAFQLEPYGASAPAWLRGVAAI
ncbi:CoA transferase [Granulicella tundricola]|uniref:L-carnitine dehydratase/bile acid-inducible protein F n=1 Tax=Granulicella tundricola (strain ATCC BAA-1859 / DSM 23138 / MP5ACTX9) TaxID=1198114 RepID=E8X0W1_GRATM|nr:CoA transferase [Granulicella tundricola]ADW70145.1 L-carnitine dehydratase/bile acid-inducible protein F [Granulicella tundricola MP5ACTX9]